MESSLRSAVRLASDELAEAVLPAVLARLKSQTDRLQGLADRISHDPRKAVADPACVDSLESDQVLGRRIGWCLGVLAAASGTDLLLARRERDGLREMLELVALALPEHPPEPPLEGLPRITTAVGEGWEIPFLLAFTYLAVARDLPASTPLRWKKENDVDVVSFSFMRAGPDRTSEAMLEELAGLVPETELAISDEHVSLRFARANFED